MRKILFIAFLTLTSMSIQAQEELTWHTDMSKATDISIKENKPLFLFLLVQIGVDGVFVYKKRYLKPQNLSNGQKKMWF